MSKMLLLAAANLSLGCASLVDLHQNLEKNLHQTSQEFSKYQKNFQASKSCENKLLKNGVVGGVSVSANDPLAKRAVLLITQRGSKTSSCTAAPLSENLLVTAAHCVSDAKPEDIRAVFHTDMNCLDGDEQKVTLKAAKISIHPEYDKTPQSKADLALVKLSTNIPADYQIAGLYDGKSVLSNDDVIMLGYGITDEQKQDSMVLRTTKKSFKSDSFVKESLIGFNQTNKSGGYCRGDSGAPIYVNSGGVMKIIGVNSFNVGKEKNRECHTASFGMYTPYFKSWILTQVVEL